MTDNDWKTDSHRESIAIGNRMTLVISMRERGWRVALLVRTEFPEREDHRESERSIACKDIDAANEDDARAAGLHWLREWLGDIATPLRLERCVQQDPDPCAPAPETIGDLDSWTMGNHEELLRSGNMRLRLYFHCGTDCYGRAVLPKWHVDLLLGKDRTYVQQIAHTELRYGPLEEARTAAIAWAREQTAKITNAFSETSP